MLKFPEYEKIKKLPLFYVKNGEEISCEYKFNLFNIYEDIYCRIIYNEDGSRLFYLDVMCDGYCDKFSGSNLHFKATKKEYKEMCDKANIIYQGVLNNLNKSNEKYSSEWFK